MDINPLNPGSQMGDRISALEAEKAALEALASNSRVSTIQKQTRAEPHGAPDDVGTAQLRLELTEAIRSRGVSDMRLRSAEEELSKLRAKTQGDSKTLRALETERATLTTKLKDREHELREKRKLLEVLKLYSGLQRPKRRLLTSVRQDVQDEMIALNLQLSVAEKERDKVKKENRELVDRWMKRMGQEADAMNLANEHKPS